MNRSAFLLLASTLLGLFLSGCASSIQPTGIHAAVISCTPTTNPSEATLTLGYTNESVYALGVIKSSHRLLLNGTAVGSIDAAPAIGLPPVKTTTQALTLHLSDPAFVRQLAASAGAGSVHYRLESTLYETVNEDDYKVKSTDEGSLDLRSFAEK